MEFIDCTTKAKGGHAGLSVPAETGCGSNVKGYGRKSWVAHSYIYCAEVEESLLARACLLEPGAAGLEPFAGPHLLDLGLPHAALLIREGEERMEERKEQERQRKEQERLMQEKIAELQRQEDERRRQEEEKKEYEKLLREYPIPEWMLEHKDGVNVGVVGESGSGKSSFNTGLSAITAAGRIKSTALKLISAILVSRKDLRIIISNFPESV